jgi:hypothetical protein
MSVATGRLTVRSTSSRGVYNKAEYKVQRRHML